MIKEIDGYPFMIVFRSEGNNLWCDGCKSEWSWKMYDDSPEEFIELHKQWHKKETNNA